MKCLKKDMSEEMSAYVHVSKVQKYNLCVFPLAILRAGSRERKYLVVANL